MITTPAPRQKDHMTTIRKAGAYTAALILAIVGVFAGASAAYATDGVATKITITNTPDDGCPPGTTPWARDTFTRTTVLQHKGGTTWDVQITDDGTFTTQPGAKTPGDGALTITGGVTGKLHGTGHYTVTGTPKTEAEIKALGGWNNAAYACKPDVPAERQTGAWAKRFFTDGATSTGIEGWTWKYWTGCEKRTESTGGAEGNITGKTCPAPSHSWSKSPSASPSASKSASPSASVSASRSASAGATAGATPTVTTTPVADTGSLPVTGPGVGIIVATGLILVGGGGMLTVAARRRRTNFTAE
jgi:hypothetical protein